MFFIFALRPAFNVGHILYYELNIDYIIEKYCINKEKPELQCNGKCFISQQLLLEQADKDTQNENTANLALIEAFFPLYYQNTKAYGLDYSPQFCKESNWGKQNFYNPLNGPVWLPPPKTA